MKKENRPNQEPKKSWKKFDLVDWQPRLTSVSQKIEKLKQQLEDKLVDVPKPIVEKLDGNFATYFKKSVEFVKNNLEEERQ